VLRPPLASPSAPAYPFVSVGSAPTLRTLAMGVGG